MKKKILAILGALLAIGVGVVGGLATGESPVKATISAVVENMDEITDAVATVSESDQEVKQSVPGKPGAGVEVVNKATEVSNALKATGTIIESVNKIMEGEPKARDSPE